MALKDILAERAADQRRLAAQGAGVSIPEATQHATNVATGMASSVNAASLAATVRKPVKGEMDPAKASTALAVYEDNDFRPLQKIIRTRGGKTLAVAGFFYAQDADDIFVLDQYASKGLVTKLDIKKD
jgi:hypothetical protein